MVEADFSSSNRSVRELWSLYLYGVPVESDYRIYELIYLFED